MTRAPIPEVVLERYRLGELPPADADALAPRIQADETVRERLEALARSDEEIRRRHPKGPLAGQVRARFAARRAAAPARFSPGGRYWPVPVALAAAVAVLAVLGSRVGIPVVPSAAPTSSAAPTERIKGLKPTLAVFRKAADHSEALADGDVARAGDLVRLGYQSAGRRFGVILSLDGRGHVTVHLPKQGRQAAPLRSGQVVLLDHAFELDDAPRWERFFFVTADAPFDLDTVMDGARRAPVGDTPPPALALPPSLEQSAFSLEKEARR